MHIADAHSLGTHVGLILAATGVLPLAGWQVHIAMGGWVAEYGRHKESVAHQELIGHHLGHWVSRVEPPQRPEDGRVVVQVPLFMHVGQDALAEVHQPRHVPA